MQANTAPQCLLDNISLGFVGLFPKVSNYQKFLSCTCWLTGFMEISPTCQRDFADRTPWHLFASWMTIFGQPNSMIRDWGKVLVSLCCLQLHSLLGINVHLTTSYDPQGDGNRHIPNKTLVKIEHHLATRNHGKWITLSCWWKSQSTPL